MPLWQSSYLFRNVLLQRSSSIFRVNGAFLNIVQQVPVLAGTPVPSGNVYQRFGPDFRGVFDVIDRSRIALRMRGVFSFEVPMML